MLRAFFDSLSRARWAQRWLTRSGFARRAAARFVAGVDRAEALRAVARLQERGIQASLDHLGESTTTAAQARSAAEEIRALLEEIDRWNARANVSIKLSQLGLLIDPDLCRELLFTILDRARALRNFVRIDMEDSSLTEAILGLYLQALRSGYENVGIVLQAYLRRTGSDLRAVLDAAGRVRLCKGAYNEPAALAYRRRAEVSAAFDRQAAFLLQRAQERGAPEASADGRFPPVPAIATHDPARIAHARQAAAGLGLSQRALEFQMLYGIRRDLQAALSAAGYPVRVYVPYGSHWYPYLMRRLGERPDNLRFFLTNLLRN